MQKVVEKGQLENEEKRRAKSVYVRERKKVVPPARERGGKQRRLAAVEWITRKKIIIGESPGPRRGVEIVSAEAISLDHPDIECEQCCIQARRCAAFSVGRGVYAHKSSYSAAGASIGH